MTAFGRRYPLPDIDHELGGFRSKAERNAINGPVQGTSADITKISMGLVYKECKARGWLDKVHLLITMHDELDFEIDDDILAEAIDTFVGIMNRNAALLRLKWPVPLTSDVELGPNWTVPWGLNKIRKTGKWPTELQGLFPGSLPKEGAPVGGSSEGGVEVKSAAPVRAKGVRVYRVEKLTFGEVERIATLFVGTPSAPATLKVEGPNGEDLTPVLMTAWGGVLPDVEAE